MGNIATFFKKKEKIALGLSIGSSAIKIAQLRFTASSAELLHFGIATLPEDSIVNREIIRSDIVTQEIKNLVRQTQGTSEKICIGISGPSVIVKRMIIEVQNKSELKDAVLWEAEQYFPFDFSEVALDFHQIGKIKDKKADILLVGTKKSTIENYMTCLVAADISLTVVDLDYFALLHVMEKNYPKRPQTIGLLDFGASSIKCVIVNENIPIFTKELTLGGAFLTQKIAEKLNVSLIEAEAFKLSPSSLPAQASELMLEEIDLIAKEIKRTFDFYHASSLGPPLQSLLITGGASFLNHLRETIESQVHIPTQPLNPFAQLKINPRFFPNQTLQKISAYASIPIGLALRMQDV